MPKPPAKEPQFTHSALRDLDSVRLWLSQPGSGARAALKRRDIVDAIRDIGAHPYRWPDSHDHPGTKDRHIHGYTIRYEIDERAGRVRILRIFGPAQNRHGI